MRNFIAALGLMSCCATVAVASPIPEALVLTEAALLKNRPTANGAVLRQLAAGAELRPVSFMENAAGLWIYASTSDGEFGWAPAEHMKDRNGMIPDARTMLAWVPVQTGPVVCRKGEGRAAGATGSP